MADKVVTCNKENGSFSQLWGRDCWVADSMLKLVISYAQTLDEKTESEETADRLKAIETYCIDLRARNKEHWYDTIATEN